MVSEKSFADLTWKNLQEVGTPTYTEEEIEFARQLQATVDPAIKDRDQRMYEAKEKALADGVVSRNAWEKAPLTASSDRKVYFTQQKSLQQQHMTCIHSRN